ncbi:type II toxin-antitoxin system RelE/ParE family toxin [Nisaea acidiphila]|uniref:Type II toxin-antitoxin system RelE/ParE family toxin n=1 Tax=Nisaea acidiphila TaxID=1862145 RepID=A0A9J7AZU6_9PROT|nr:type II toxin-antitoxin system RelE/ParE family toxin [Nisaea acidiphila]UUX51945.1 type II toxin-antitoxin system RelE/ParE family toxin [Nisaea acidiphila]
MKWRLEIDARAAKELRTFPADIKARILRIGELLTEFGPENVGQPHVRHLKDKLWEIRASGRDGIGRALYFITEGRRIVILSVFIKKTRKAPDRETAKAIKRMLDHG